MYDVGFFASSSIGDAARQRRTAVLAGYHLPRVLERAIRTEFVEMIVYFEDNSLAP
jgi:hypothetical protein